ncbi:MAG TPA: class I SAM-dependent rRNA methyltransferase [Blastocatellia bacterium]|nr:class I SAM-dependent rRNA methyltransferase [Blastocatellia bacterium]
MRTTSVTVNRRGVERAVARHLWIYRSDLISNGNAQGGEIVRVLDAKSRFVGWALYSSSSQIALRFLTFDDVAIDHEFWSARLKAAEQLRNRVVSAATAYRLVYGESDLLPSLIVDRYNDCLVIQTLSQGMEALKSLWVELLVDRYHPRAIVERNEARVRDLEGLPRIAGPLLGDPGELIIHELDIQYSVNLIEGQKTGTFLDQRENRIAAAPYARGRVLDCFTFQGAFALHFAKGSDSVLACDISPTALAQAQSNAQLNGSTNIEFAEANVFDFLHAMDSRGEQFDLINLDPPAFAKNRASIEAAMRGYKEINLRAIKLLKPGGTLVTSTCSYHMSEEMFLNCIAEAASDARRSVQILEKRGQARDHPVMVSMPETQYLKCVIATVV